MNDAAINGFRLVDAASLVAGEILRVADTPVGPLALVRVDGRAHALRDPCPHAGALLSQGFIEGRRVVCPTHFAAFDVETGAVHDAPANCRPAQTYPVAEHEGGLFLACPEPNPAERLP